MPASVGSRNLCDEFLTGPVFSGRCLSCRPNRVTLQLPSRRTLLAVQLVTGAEHYGGLSREEASIVVMIRSPDVLDTSSDPNGCPNGHAGKEHDDNEENPSGGASPTGAVVTGDPSPIE
jgi:hypothetical protein